MRERRKQLGNQYDNAYKLWLSVGTREARKAALAQRYAALASEPLILKSNTNSDVLTQVLRSEGLGRVKETIAINTTATTGGASTPRGKPGVKPGDRRSAATPKKSNRQQPDSGQLGLF